MFNYTVQVLILIVFTFEINNCYARNLNFVRESNNEHELRMHPVLNFQSPSKRLQKRAMPSVNFKTPTNVETISDYWNGVAQNILQNQLKKSKLNTNKAKNVILFLGDGMSIPTISAGRVYMGGEEKQFAFEKFPYVGLSKTYCANTQVADSACTATAYLSGIKGNYGTIGVTSAVDLNNCEAQNNTKNHASSIAEWAQTNGMLTGLITTTAVTHASPSGVYAHIANRNWENDAEIKNDVKSNDKQIKCNDIAKQLIYNKVGHNLAVVMGGGREQFLPNTERDILGGKGKRTDSENLIKSWLERHNNHNTTGAFVQNKDDLSKLPVDTDFVLGLFGTSHLPYHLDVNENIENKVPSLAEMVSKAIDILEAKNQGYFLFVEGGRIDHAHHDTEALKALDETVEFDKAIELARRRTNHDDTLIVVTSDHSHTMSMAGYSSRKNDILGINNGQIANDALPYSTLSYANGPGRNYLLEHGKRRNLKNINMTDKNYKYPAMVPLDSETHGGDDVAVFASGPFAHIFSGVYEQNFIPHAIAYASCIGSMHTSCSSESPKNS